MKNKTKEEYLLLHEERLLNSLEKTHTSIHRTYVAVYGLIFVIAILLTNMLKELALVGAKIDGENLSTYIILSLLLLFFSAQNSNYIIKLCIIIFEININSGVLKKLSDDYLVVNLREVNLYNTGYLSSFLSFLNQLIVFWRLQMIKLNAVNYYFITKNNSFNKLFRCLSNKLKILYSFFVSLIIVIVLLVVLILFFVAPYIILFFLWNSIIQQQKFVTPEMLATLQSFLWFLNILLLFLSIYSIISFYSIIDLYITSEIEEYDDELRKSMFYNFIKKIHFVYVFVIDKYR